MALKGQQEFPLWGGSVLYLHCNVVNILVVYCAIVLQDAVIWVNWVEGIQDLFVFFLRTVGEFTMILNIKLRYVSIFLGFVA